MVVRALDQLLFNEGYQKRIKCLYTPQNGWWKGRISMWQKLDFLCLFVMDYLLNIGSILLGVQYIYLTECLLRLSFVTLFELLCKQKPTYDYMRTYECLYYPYTMLYNSNNLKPRSIYCVFLGYLINQKTIGAWILSLRESMPTHMLYFMRQCFLSFFKPSTFTYNTIIAR